MDATDASFSADRDADPFLGDLPLPQRPASTGATLALATRVWAGNIVCGNREVNVLRA